MADLIGALGEMLAAMIAALVALLPIVAEVTVYVLVCSIGIILYALSPKFRNRKKEEWKGQPLRKYLFLGTSGVCVAAIVALSVFLLFPRPRPDRRSNDLAMEQAREGEERRLVIKTDSGEGATNQVRIAVKEGGVTKILHTKSMDDLKQALRENVTVEKSKTDATNQVRS